MNRPTSIRTEFVDRIPKTLSEGVLYISRKYSTAAHNCYCGCGVKIVTPIKPGRWQLVLDGDRASLYPSVGNWSSACQSHYWIRNNQIEWARSYSDAEIAANRQDDYRVIAVTRAQRYDAERGFWGRLWKWIARWFS
jgi:hypothetical protein